MNEYLEPDKAFESNDQQDANGDTLERTTKHQSRNQNISFNIKSNKDSLAQWSSVQTQQAEVQTDSFRNFTRLDSEEKRVQSQHVISNVGKIIVQFAERLCIRDSLCRVQDNLQQFESIILTMCCKENPDLYNSLIIDLQGFSDMNARTHFDVLSVVRIQSERLSQLIMCFLATKYDMNKFRELMASIISPTQQKQLETSGSESNYKLRQKSFSFEGSSAGLKYGNKYSSGGNQGMNRSKVSEVNCGATNPFVLGQESSRSKGEQSISNGSSSHGDLNQERHFQNNEEMILQVSSPQTEESPRSPLRLEEVKLCNEMIDRLRAECQEYELTIVEQDREIAQLKEIIHQQNQHRQDPKTMYLQNMDRQETQSLINRLQAEVRSVQAENELQQNQLEESNSYIAQLQDQLKDNKSRVEDRRQEIRRDVEMQMQQRELETIKQDNTQLKQKFNEIQAICRQRETQIADIEKQAQQTLQQAQLDAEECIAYFKTLALQSKNKQLGTREEPVFNKRGSIFPISLAPATPIQATTVHENSYQYDKENHQVEGKGRVRAKSAANKKNQFLSKDDFSFRLSDEHENVKQQANESITIDSSKVLIAIEAMTRAFEEVSSMKQGLLLQVTQYRDIYCDQIKQFSVLSYDYLEKLQIYVNNDQIYKSELETQSNTTQELKQVTLQQTKHIRAQHELIMAQKDKLSMLADFMDKSIKQKNKEQRGFCKMALSQLPLLSDSLMQTHQQVSLLKEREFQSGQSLNELIKIHEMTKTKVRLLEEELEKSLQQNQEANGAIQDQQQRYERLAGLIQDVWIAEVKEFQQGVPDPKQFSFVRRSDHGGRSDGVGSVESVLSSEMVPMPVNWLSEIRDTLRQLRETNDFQKDECFQMLNLINTSMQNEINDRTETDGQTFQQSDDDSSRGIDDIRSECAISQEKHDGAITRRSGKYKSRSRNDVNSPRPTMPKSTTSNRKVLIQHMTEKNDFNQRPIRSTSADHNRGLTSQRTPKNVRFNQPPTPVLASSFRSMGPKINQLSSGGGSVNGNNRNELLQMLRDEIYKMKRDYNVSRETIVQMQHEIKALRRELHDTNCDNDQAHNDLQNQIQQTEQTQMDLKEVQQLLEESEERVRQKEQTIEQLKSQIDEFECELGDLQHSMAKVAALNGEISQQCEHWELSHQQAQQELLSLRQLNDQKIQKMQEVHEDKLKQLKKKIQDKDAVLQENSVVLQREKDFRSAVEMKRQNVMDASTDANDYLPLLEGENQTLRGQLNNVKQDVSAVLEQYDRQNSINKQLKKKLEKIQQTNNQLIDELNQSRKEIDNLSQQLKQSQLDNQQMQLIQAHYQQEIQQEHQINEQLQQQIEEVTQLAEELQSQIQGSTNDTEQIKRQYQICENNVKQLEARIREMLSDSHQDKKTIAKYREKIAALKRYRTHSRQNQHGLSQIQQQQSLIASVPRQPSANRRQITVSHGNSQEFSSDTPSPRSEFPQARNDHITVTDYQYQDQDARSQFKRANSRGSTNIQYNTSYQAPDQQRNTRQKVQTKSPAATNPFTNLSNMSGVFDSLRGTQDERPSSATCCCGNNNCYASQHTKPSFFQPSTDMNPTNNQYQELKWKVEADKQCKIKVKRVIKFIEDLVKNHCKQVMEKTTAPNSIAPNSSRQHLNLNKHVQEWSAEQLIDCWSTEEDSAIIEAKAYFNKHSPVTLTCLRLLIENKNKTSVKESQNTHRQPPTLVSSQFQIPRLNSDDSQQSTNRSNCRNTEMQPTEQRDVIEAYGLLANHCQSLLQNYIQIGRSLAGICFGGCILVGQNFTQEIRENVDFAMKFLAHDTSLLDSTKQNTMQEIYKVVESLVTCLQQIVKTSCQVILNRSSLSKNEANKMLESMQQSYEYSVTNAHSSVHTKSNSGFGAQLPHTFAHNTSRAETQNAQKEVREKLIVVENRLKSKFQHVSKLEASLDKLLIHQLAEKSSLNDTSQQSFVSNVSSVLSDTKTVMKLLSTVKRVVSKLKIELHQDYLSLGNINVGLLMTPSHSSYSLSQDRTNEAHVQGGIMTSQLAPVDKENNIKSFRGGSTEAKQVRDVTFKEEMSKIIDDMSGLTFEESLPMSSRRRTTQSQQMTTLV